MAERGIAGVHVGDALGPLVKRPSRVSLFRFSAATWNAHRLHYDQPFSEKEGVERPLVQAYLLGAYLVQLIQGWAGPSARLQKIAYRARSPVAVEEEVSCLGTVTAVDGRLVDLELRIEHGSSVCMTGSARVALP